MDSNFCPFFPTHGTESNLSPGLGFCRDGQVSGQTVRDGVPGGGVSSGKVPAGNSGSVSTDWG